jgi:hypothetical protein
MQQKSMFQVLAVKPFFMYYLQRKMLAQWQASARHSSFCSHRQLLVRNCFLAKPRFAASLQHAHSTTRKLYGARVLQVDSSPCSLEEFVDLQDSVQSLVPEQLEQTREALQQIVDTCIHDIRRANVVKERLPEVVGTSSCSKSMFLERSEARERARQLHIATRDVGMLADFIRTIDYMFQGSLVSLSVAGALELDKQLTACKLSLRVSCGRANDSATLIPSTEEIEESFRQVQKNAANIAGSVPSFLSASHYNDFSHALIRQPLRDSVLKSSAYVACSRRIRKTISEQVEQACELASGAYEPVWRFKTYAPMKGDHSDDSSLAHLKCVERELQQEIARFRVRYRAGNILLDATAARIGLEDVLSRLMRRIKDVSQNAQT